MNYKQNTNAKLRIGLRVVYDSFPEGHNIDGVIVEDGILATGRWAAELKASGISEFISWEHQPTNVRLVINITEED